MDTGELNRVCGTRNFSHRVRCSLYGTIATNDLHIELDRVSAGLLLLRKAFTDSLRRKFEAFLGTS